MPAAEKGPIGAWNLPLSNSQGEIKIPKWNPIASQTQNTKGITREN